MSYDAAGNRNDAVTDNLNRATAVSGTACTNDLLGNRLTMGSNSYGWDQVNRMKSYNTTTYTYRADGMRTYKTSSSGSTSYRYDGQMGMEDADFAANGTVSKTTDFAIGARGIDAIYVTQIGTKSSSYSIYDAHGSMISTLAEDGMLLGEILVDSLDDYNCRASSLRSALGFEVSYLCLNLHEWKETNSGGDPILNFILLILKTSQGKIRDCIPTVSN